VAENPCRRRAVRRRHSAVSMMSLMPPAHGQARETGRYGPPLPARSPVRGRGMPRLNAASRCAPRLERCEPRTRGEFAD